MKKKYIIIICCIILFISTIFAVAFLIKTNSLINNENVKINVQQLTDSLQGTWFFAAFDKDMECIVRFDGDTIECDGNKQLFPSGSFTINNNGHMIIKQGEFDLMIDKPTDEVCKFIDTNSGHQYTIIKKSSDQSVSKDELLGDWTVLLHGNTFVSNEQLSITDNTIKLYKDNNDNAVLNSMYSFDESSVITLDSSSLMLKTIKIEKDIICFIEKDSGYVWEIKKVR